VEDEGQINVDGFARSAAFEFTYSFLLALLNVDPKYPNRYRFDLSAAEIEELSSKLIAASKGALDEIVASTDKDRPTWAILQVFNRLVLSIYINIY